MTRKIRSTFLLAALLMIQNTNAFEKVGATSFQFLKVMNNARGTAMGEAFSAVATTSDALFWNPGAVTEIAGRYDFTTSQTDWFLDTRHFAFSMAYKHPSLGVFGLMGLIIDMGSIMETNTFSLGYDDEFNYNPGLTGKELKIGAQAFGLAYARNLTNKFSFGTLVKYVREDLYYAAASNIMFDIGLLYRSGYRSIKISSVVRHFGPEVIFTQERDSTLIYAANVDSVGSIEGEGYPLPQTFNIGISAYLIAPESSLLFTNPVHSLLASFDMIHPRDYDQQYGIGLEYGYNDMFFLRGGYKINYDEEGLCLGLGFKVGSFRIDYSYNDYGKYLGSINRFSIGMQVK